MPAEEILSELSVKKIAGIRPDPDLRLVDHTKWLETKIIFKLAVRKLEHRLCQASQSRQNSRRRFSLFLLVPVFVLIVRIVIIGARVILLFGI